MNFPPSFLADPGSSRTAKFNELLDLLSGPLPILNLQQYLESCEYLRANFKAEMKMLTKTPFKNSARTILSPGPLYFAPDSNEMRSLIEYLNTTYSKFQSLDVKLLSSERAVYNDMNSDPFVLPFGFIHFQTSRQNGKTFNIDIRQGYDQYFSTNQFVSKTWVGFDIFFINYWMGGFFSLQRGVESWLCGQIQGCDVTTFAPTAIIPFPTPSYQVYNFFTSIGAMFGIFLSVATIFPVSRQAKCLVDDKESGVRDLLYMMGLQPLAYTVGNFALYFLLYFWLAVSTSLFLSVSIFHHTHFSVLFTIYLLFNLTQQLLSLFLASVCQRGKVAAIVSAITIFVFALPRYFFISSVKDEFVILKYFLCCLFPTSAFIFAIDFLVENEYVGRGMEIPSLSPTKFNLASTLLCMFISIFFYGAITHIISSWKYDWAKHKYCTASALHSTDAHINRTNCAFVNRPLVEVRNLCKAYSGGHVALRSVSLVFNENQITCLLGQNGAGKSTFVSILAGIRLPTSGSIHLGGQDLFELSWSERCKIGICTQKDILVPSLTVLEHMKLIVEIKGLHYSTISVEEEITTLLTRLELLDKKHIQTQFLSGGMKRKVCLAMALIGNPLLVILDEPTSGVDALSRRKIWEVLHAYKQKKAILLTTHFMDEAETLSDQVVMISQGNVVCQGTVADLKAACGQSGYLISFSKSSSSDDNEYGLFLQKEMETAVECSIDSYSNSSQNEVSFHIPFSKQLDLAMLFRRLQSSRYRVFEDVRLRSITLEHAFLAMVGWTASAPLRSPMNTGMIARAKSVIDENSTSSPHQSAEFFKELFSLQSLCVWWESSQFGVLMWRKFVQYRRDRIGTTMLLTLPALAMLLSTTVLLINLSPSYRRLPLSVMTFPKQVDFQPHLYISDDYPNYLAMGNVSKTATSIKNSTEMSMFLQATKPSPREITGALIYKDTIPIHLTINASWVLKNPVMALTFTKLFGMPHTKLLIENIIDGGKQLLLVEVSENTTKPATSSLILSTSSHDNNISKFAMPLIDANTQLWNNALTVMHRSPYTHSAAIFNAEVARYSMVALAGLNTPILYVSNFPLPQKESVSTFAQIQLSVVIVILLLIPICCLPATLVAFVVKEKFNRSKLLQHLNSVSSMKYWTSNWLFDFLLLLIPMTIFLSGILLLKIVLVSVFTKTWEAFGSLVIVLFSYCFAVIPFCYILGIHGVSDRTPSSAVVFTLLVNIITGFGFTIAYFVAVGQQVAATSAKSAIVMQSIFSIFPAFNLGNALVRICTTYYQNTLRGQNYTFLSWNATLTPIVILIAQGIFYFGLLLCLDDGPQQRNNPLTSFINTNKRRDIRSGAYCFVDDDILSEELQVINVMHSLQSPSMPPSSSSVFSELGDIELAPSMASMGGEFPLVIHQLCKVYPSSGCSCPGLRTSQPGHMALRGISLACKRGERLGLLGINGAGKTTTMSILTGEIEATSGEVYIDGRPLSDPQTMTMLGYCPQVDPLLELMNAYETLWFYGRIRGIPTSILQSRVVSLITQTGLLPHAHRPSGTYSGGNKRKLSLAVALIGDPKVLLLDEPSIGMDPEARRQMWNVIQQVSENRTVILVSHSMEEIEALCTRVAVLVGGQLRCLGSIPHLKSKYNAGYEVSFRCHPQYVQDCIARCKEFLVPENRTAVSGGGDQEQKVDDAYVTCEEMSNGGLVVLKVGRDLDLPKAFAGFNEITTGVFAVQDLNISLGSLDGVFKKSVENSSESLSL